MSDIRITLAAARVNAGLTQEQAAEKLGVTKMTLLNWEKGKVIPKPAYIEMMSRVYNLPRDVFFLPSELTES